VESAHGQMLPQSVAAPLGAKNTHLIHTVHGQPTHLDGEKIDTNPLRRLAGYAQRIALAFRDRQCTFEGCSRPATWSLHAHHEIPYSQGGETTVANMRLLCAEHHTLAHHPGHE
jgi:5-methylcytosine-specific restriction endonuclease McrA